MTLKDIIDKKYGQLPRDCSNYRAREVCLEITLEFGKLAFEAGREKRLIEFALPQEYPLKYNSFESYLKELYGEK